METPDGNEAEYSMCQKVTKRSGTIIYECSMKKAKDREPCQATTVLLLVHYYDEQNPTLAYHNHPPPNRRAKTAINRAKDEATQFRDHRVSGIIDRAHGELDGMS